MAGLLFALLAVGCRRSDSRPAVILYCAQDQVFAEPLLAAFTRESGWTVKPVFDSEAVKTVGLANRLLAERTHPVADVFWGNEELRTRQLTEAGVFRPTNGWVAFGQRSRRLVMPSQPEAAVPPPPASLLDLTNSIWRGRVSLALPLFGTTATHFLALRQHWGESNWLVWCRALAANQPFIEEGNSHVIRRVARGEAWIGLTDSDDITAGQREGVPVVALPLEALSLLIPNTVGVVAKSTPLNPGTQLLVQYLQSAPVQASLITVGALESAGSPVATMQPDWPKLVREIDVGTAQLREIFQP
ncbi:MAG: substrate-binding domain-containing protein [Verrucomicrobia bacterium]|nr:substrate-binding domain-containing protein [Verrucomicrobiota bacterium]